MGRPGQAGAEGTAGAEAPRRGRPGGGWCLGMVVQGDFVAKGVSRPHQAMSAMEGGDTSFQVGRELLTVLRSDRLTLTWDGKPPLASVLRHSFMIAKQGVVMLEPDPVWQVTRKGLILGSGSRSSLCDMLKAELWDLIEEIRMMLRLGACLICGIVSECHVCSHNLQLRLRDVRPLHSFPKYLPSAHEGPSLGTHEQAYETRIPPHMP